MKKRAAPKRGCPFRYYDAQRARASCGDKRVLQNSKKLYKKLASSLVIILTRNFLKPIDISFILVYTYIRR